MLQRARRSGPAFREVGGLESEVGSGGLHSLRGLGQRPPPREAPVPLPVALTATEVMSLGAKSTLLVPSAREMLSVRVVWNVLVAGPFWVYN